MLEWMRNEVPVLVTLPLLGLNERGNYSILIAVQGFFTRSFIAPVSEWCYARMARTTLHRHSYMRWFSSVAFRLHMFKFKRNSLIYGEVALIISLSIYVLTEGLLVFIRPIIHTDLIRLWSPYLNIELLAYLLPVLFIRFIEGLMVQVFNVSKSKRDRVSKFYIKYYSMYLVLCLMFQSLLVKVYKLDSTCIMIVLDALLGLSRITTILLCLDKKSSIVTGQRLY